MKGTKNAQSGIFLDGPWHRFSFSAHGLLPSLSPETDPMRWPGNSALRRHWKIGSHTPIHPGQWTLYKPNILLYTFFHNMIMKSYPYPHKFFFIQKTLPKCAQADQCLAGCGPASPLLFARQSCTRLSRVPISDSSRLVGPHQISVHSSTI